MPAIFRYARLRLGDESRAEDATAEVFEHAFRSIESYEERGLPVRAWLFGIARNVVASHRRWFVRQPPQVALEAFDAPNGEVSCVRRVRSNTPLQALVTLNEPLFLECARSLALKTLERRGASDEERLAYAFRRATARMPDETESATLLALLKEQTQRFSQEGAQPWALAANDPANPPPLPEGITPAQAAAWTAVSRVILNLDETITKE